MSQRHYTILLHEDREQGGYWVTVPALLGILTQGDTLEQVIANAREAISLHLRGMIADGEPIPEDEENTQAVTIVVEAPAV
ncbi:MAG: type II toxin-antitoxin system HicB family antitoxin [Chloroflexi bacterium]|nr:type II toxin-antitoxin system HicB family antitoxin [Chloroflexota bacterium]